MATRIPTGVRNAITDAVSVRVDAGSGAGYIEIRTGTQPASAGSAASGTLLVTIAFADPAFGTSVGGVGTADVTPILTGTAIAAGTAGWARIYDSTGATVLDCSAGASGGGTELQLATADIVINMTVTISAGTITAPAST